MSEETPTPWPKWQVGAAVGAVAIAATAGYMYYRSKSGEEERSKSETPSTASAENASSSGAAAGSASETKDSQVRGSTSANAGAPRTSSTAAASPKPAAEGYQVMKSKGNSLYREGKYSEAVEAYKEGLAQCPETEKVQQSIFHQNIAATYERQAEHATDDAKRNVSWSEVRDACTAALELNQKYTKAYTRRARSNYMLKDYSMALEDITAANLLETTSNPSDPRPSDQVMQLATRILRELGEHKASELYESRPPIKVSKNFIKTYLDSFFYDLGKFYDVSDQLIAECTEVAERELEAIGLSDDGQEFKGAETEKLPASRESIGYGCPGAAAAAPAATTTVVVEPATPVAENGSADLTDSAAAPQPEDATPEAEVAAASTDAASEEQAPEPVAEGEAEADKSDAQPEADTPTEAQAEAEEDSAAPVPEESAAPAVEESVAPDSEDSAAPVPESPSAPDADLPDDPTTATTEAVREEAAGDVPEEAVAEREDGELTESSFVATPVAEESEPGAHASEPVVKAQQQDALREEGNRLYARAILKYQNRQLPLADQAARRALLFAADSEGYFTKTQVAHLRLIEAAVDQMYARFDSSMKALEAVIAFDSSIPAEILSHALIMRGSQFLVLGKPDEALQDLQRASSVTPSSADVFHHRGQMHALLNHMTEAMADYTEATKLAPNWAAAHVQLAYTTYKMASLTQDSSLLNKCMSQFEEIKNKFPKYAEGLYMYGQVVADAGNIAETERLYEAARKADPSNASVRVHEALLVLQKDQDFERTHELLKKALEIDPNNDFVYETMAQLEVQRQNIDKAVQYWDKALMLVRTRIEMVHLFSVREATVAQSKMCERLGVKLTDFGPEMW